MKEMAMSHNTNRKGSIFSYLLLSTCDGKHGEKCHKRLEELETTLFRELRCHLTWVMRDAQG